MTIPCFAQRALQLLTLLRLLPQLMSNRKKRHTRALVVAVRDMVPPPRTVGEVRQAVKPAEGARLGGVSTPVSAVVPQRQRTVVTGYGEPPSLVSTGRVASFGFLEELLSFLFGDQVEADLLTGWT